jgi:hypothetical protein
VSIERWARVNPCVHERRRKVIICQCVSGTRRRSLIGGAIVAVLLVVVLAFVVGSRDDRCVEPTLAVVGNGVELSEGDDGVEVVVTSDEEFAVGALAWILRIGRLEFDRSSYPGGTLTQLSFPIPLAAVPLLEDGDGIGVRYGNPIGSGTNGYALADVDIDRKSGFATLRVYDACSTAPDRAAHRAAVAQRNTSQKPPTITMGRSNGRSFLNHDVRGA